MKYQVIRNSDGHIVEESTRKNNAFIVQSVNSCVNGGFFVDGTVSLFCDGEEIDPEFIINSDEKRYQDWFDRKSITHKQVTMTSGASVFGSKHKVWVKK